MTAQPSPYRTVIETMFRVVDRRGVAVDFRLNDAQCDLDSRWSRRNLITKIRQHSGISTYVIGRYVAKCLAEDNRRCVIVSAESDATSRLLARARYILNNLKGPKPVLGTDNQRAITFPKTGSSFWIGTAGSRTFGRGDTITDLHLSEAAFYADAPGLASGLLPAAELGEVTVESTGNGTGNWFHRQAVQAREGRGFKLFFYGWEGVSSCAIPFASASSREEFLGELNADWEEPALYASGVSLEQLQWRRERLIEYEGDLRRFKENYPRDFDECFQSTGYGFFQRVRYEQTPAWHRESAALWTLGDHPIVGHLYVIGADVGGGVGQNNSVASVFDLVEQRQVAEWVSARHEPDQFGRELATLGARFNNAYINVERNNHGLTTLASLVGTYPLVLIHRGSHGEAANQEVLSRLSHYGTLVGPSTRGILIGNARRLLAEEFTIHSPALRSELGTFIEKEDGKIEAEAGCLDDRVFAAVHALNVIERAGIVATGTATAAADSRDPSPFSFDAIFGDQGAERELHGTPARYH